MIIFEALLWWNGRPQFNEVFHGITLSCHIFHNVLLVHRRLDRKYKVKHFVYNDIFEDNDAFKGEANDSVIAILSLRI